MTIVDPRANAEAGFQTGAQNNRASAGTTHHLQITEQAVSQFQLKMGLTPVLVMMLTEVLSQWFKDGPWTRLAVLGAILLTLGAMRVVAVRYSPTQGDASTRSHESLF